MMLALAAALVTQIPVWTVRPTEVAVGDTVEILGRVALPDPAARLRASALEATLDAELLEGPITGYDNQSATIVYRVALFGIDSVVLTVPPIEVLTSDGAVQTLASHRLTISLASVLPTADTLPAPRGSVAPIGRRTFRPEPPLVLGAIATLTTIGLALNRRRLPRRPPWRRSLVRPAEPPVEKWVAAGEPRAILSLVAIRLRERIEGMVPGASKGETIDRVMEVVRRDRPTWPADTLEELLRSLERSSFAPAVTADVMEVVQRVESTLRSLEESTEAEVES